MSPWRALTVPYATIILGSIIPAVFLVDSVPIIPPLGYLFLLCWRIMRPGLLPLWIGVPLGIIDDIFSGQPFGSAILLWSLTMIALEAIETRFPWRGFWQDWFTAGLAIVLYILAAMMVSGTNPTPVLTFAVLPQIALSIVLYPVMARFVSRLDGFRLAHSRRIG
ncbi:MAG: rod shape-determining protein MreD [Pseudomonadota bacterium]